MWGAIRTKDENKLVSFLKEMIITPTSDIWDYDQILLRRIVWPQVVNQIVSTDNDI